MSGSERGRFIALNAVGGVAVLASYAHGLATHPELRPDVWGGVPDGLRPLYTVNMLLAAVGYFAFTPYLLLRVDPGRVRVGRFGWRLFEGLYAGILLCSALWMPLTFRLLEHPSQALWWMIRLDLAVVGLCSLALLVALARLEPRRAPGWNRLAQVGAFFFTLQTALLDAIVWPAYFPI